MKSNRMYLYLLAALAVPASPTTAIADDGMQPGAWEMRVNVSARESTTEEFKTVTNSVSKFCFSKAFLDKDPYLTARLDKAKMEEKNAKCTIADEKRTANSASWKLACTLADGTVSKGTVSNHVSASTLKSEIEQKVTKKGKTGFVKITMDGSFLGVCTKDMPEL